MAVTMSDISGRMLRVIVLAIVIDELLGVTAEARAADWPQWRGPNRDGMSIEKDWTTRWPAKGPRLLWQAPVGNGYSSFAVVASRLYTMGFIVDEPGPDKKYKKERRAAARQGHRVVSRR